MKKTNKAVRQPVESVMKRRWKNHHKPFGKSYKPLKVFAHPLKALRKPLKPLEKPLATRWLAVGFCPFNTKPLVYVFAWKVTFLLPALPLVMFSGFQCDGTRPACCSEGHHGYLLLLLVTPSVCPGSFPTSINWRCCQTFSCGPFTHSCTAYIVQSTLALWTPRYNEHPTRTDSS